MPSHRGVAESQGINSSYVVSFILSTALPLQTSSVCLSGRIKNRKMIEQEDGSKTRIARFITDYINTVCQAFCKPGYMQDLILTLHWYKEIINGIKVLSMKIERYSKEHKVRLPGVC